jgi:hypothetical protein
VTVDQAIAVLAQMSGAGHGARPLKLQIVEDGITYAEEIKHFDVARDYDGEIVWAYTGEREDPEWMVKP